MEKLSVKAVAKQADLIYVDEFQLTQLKQSIKEAEKALNSFVSFTMSVIGQLPDEKIQELRTNAIDVIRNELKSRFQFPNATEEFNLSALGIDPTPIYAMHMNAAPKWSPFQFELKDGVFMASEKQSQIDDCYVFADTPERKKFFDLINKTMGVYNELRDAKILRYPGKFDELFIPNLFVVDRQNNIKLSNVRIQNIVNDIGRGITI